MYPLYHLLALQRKRVYWLHVFDINNRKGTRHVYLIDCSSGWRGVGIRGVRDIGRSWWDNRRGGRRLLRSLVSTLIIVVVTLIVVPSVVIAFLIVLLQPVFVGLEEYTRWILCSCPINTFFFVVSIHTSSNKNKPAGARFKTSRPRTLTSTPVRAPPIAKRTRSTAHFCNGQLLSLSHPVPEK